MLYTGGKDVTFNEGGYTDYSAWDPFVAQAAGLTPSQIIASAENAGLGTSGRFFGGQNNVASDKARNIFSSDWFKSLGSDTQTALLSDYKSKHSDSGWGAFLGALGLAAAPFAIGAATGTLGGSSAAATTGGTITAAGTPEAAFAGMNVPGAGSVVATSIPAASGSLGSSGLLSAASKVLGVVATATAIPNTIKPSNAGAAENAFNNMNVPGNGSSNVPAPQSASSGPNYLLYVVAFIVALFVIKLVKR